MPLVLKWPGLACMPSEALEVGSHRYKLLWYLIARLNCELVCSFEVQEPQRLFPVLSIIDYTAWCRYMYKNL